MARGGGDAATADALTRWLLDVPSDPGFGPIRWRYAVRLIHPQTPPDSRRTLVQKELEFLLWLLQNGRRDEVATGEWAIANWTFLDGSPT